MNIPFDTYSHVSTWTATPYTDGTRWQLELYDCHKRDTYNKPQVAYRFSEQKPMGDWVTIFEGNDPHLGAGYRPNSERAIYAALFWFGLKPGDTDADFFGSYTPEQLAWAEANGDNLGWLVTYWEEIDNGQAEDEAEEGFAEWGVEIVYH